MSFITRVSKRILSQRFKKMLAICVIVSGVLFATFPYTVYRGWSYAEKMIQFVHWFYPQWNIDVNTIYGVESKVLAYVADIAFFVFVILIIIMLYHMFFSKDEDNKTTKKSIGDVNREIKMHLTKLQRKRK